MGTNKYENGKIYRITNTAYTKFYYGSTYESLSKRFWRHKQVYRDYLQGKASYQHSICLLFDEFGAENCKIELVELYPTQSKIELVQREGYYIQTNDCVNKVVAGRTAKQYYNDNKEKYSQRFKEWYRKKTESTRHWNNERYLQSKEKRTSIFYCDCGSSFQRQNKSHHIKTKSHQKWLKQQEPEVEPQLEELD